MQLADSVDSNATFERLEYKQNVFQPPGVERIPPPESGRTVRDTLLRIWNMDAKIEHESAEKSAADVQAHIQPALAMAVILATEQKAQEALQAAVAPPPSHTFVGRRHQSAAAAHVFHYILPHLPIPVGATRRMYPPQNLEICTVVVAVNDYTGNQTKINLSLRRGSKHIYSSESVDLLPGSYYQYRVTYKEKGMFKSTLFWKEGRTRILRSVMNQFDFYVPESAPATSLQDAHSKVMLFAESLLSESKDAEVGVTLRAFHDLQECVGLHGEAARKIQAQDDRTHLGSVADDLQADVVIRGVINQRLSDIEQKSKKKTSIEEQFVLCLQFVSTPDRPHRQLSHHHTIREHQRLEVWVNHSGRRFWVEAKVLEVRRWNQTCKVAYTDPGSQGRFKLVVSPNDPSRVRLPSTPAKQDGLTKMSDQERSDRNSQCMGMLLWLHPQLHATLSDFISAQVRLFVQNHYKTNGSTFEQLVNYVVASPAIDPDLDAVSGINRWKTQVQAILRKQAAAGDADIVLSTFIDAIQRVNTVFDQSKGPFVLAAMQQMIVDATPTAGILVQLCKSNEFWAGQGPAGAALPLMKSRMVQLFNSYRGSLPQLVPICGGDSAILGNMASALLELLLTRIMALGDMSPHARAGLPQSLLLDLTILHLEGMNFTDANATSKIFKSMLESSHPDLRALFVQYVCMPSKPSAGSQSELSLSYGELDSQMRHRLCEKWLEGSCRFIGAQNPIMCIMEALSQLPQVLRDEHVLGSARGLCKSYTTTVHAASNLFTCCSDVYKLTRRKTQNSEGLDADSMPCQPSVRTCFLDVVKECVKRLQAGGGLDPVQVLCYRRCC
jgi:hypothetical protein